MGSKGQSILAAFPVFTKQPANVTVQTSDRFRLDCGVDGDPKPLIYWQFNFGHNFSAANERRLLLLDESLIIENAKINDSGIYTCTAENQAGKITKNVTVEISKSESSFLMSNRMLKNFFLFSVEPLTYIKPMEHKEVMIGDYTILECSNSGTALSEVRWFKNSKPILSADSRYLLTKKNQLLILSKTTEDDAGLYTCELENALGIEKSLIQLRVRTEPITVKESEGYSHEEIMAIILVTVICCAIGTSIIWILIMYHTKQNHEYDGNNDVLKRNDVSDANIHSTKDSNLKSVNVSMLPKGDEKPVQAMRTATISRCHGVLRSNSGSSCGHSSLGVSDDIFRRYKDDGSMSNTPLHRPNRNGTDTDDDEANNDHEALLGTTYFDRYGKAVKCSDNDSFVVQMDDAVDGTSSQHDTSAGNTTTAECGDFDDGQHSSTKTKTSTSLSSSCHSIPALPLNSSHEFDLNRSQCNNSIASSNSPFASNHHIATNGSSAPNKPVIHPVAVAKPKPTIQTNKLNELMSTFK